MKTKTKKKHRILSNLFTDFFQSVEWLKQTNLRWDSWSMLTHPASTLIILEICVKPSSLRNKDWSDARWPWMCQSNPSQVSFWLQSATKNSLFWCLINKMLVKHMFQGVNLQKLIPNYQTWDTMGRSHAAPHPLAAEAPIAPKLPPTLLDACNHAMSEESISTSI